LATFVRVTTPAGNRVTVTPDRSGFAELRVDNAGNRRYAGSGIVNEANRRSFEPVQLRNSLLAATRHMRVR
jgi:hypothetical protein